MNQITDFTDGGKCSNCGACCSNFLPMSKGEVERIKRYVKKHGIKEQRKNFVQGLDMTCPFRDEANRKCLVYAVRPAICRQFMCNHTEEDIMKAKFDFHAINMVCDMRREFFGSKDGEKFFAEVLNIVANGGIQP